MHSWRLTSKHFLILLVVLPVLCWSNFRLIVFISCRIYEKIILFVFYWTIWNGLRCLHVYVGVKGPLGLCFCQVSLLLWTVYIWPNVVSLPHSNVVIIMFCTKIITPQKVYYKHEIWVCKDIKLRRVIFRPTHFEVKKA